MATLYLIPTFLSDEGNNTLPAQTINIAAGLDEFIVEDEKSARRFLKNIGTKIPQASLVFHLLNEHTSPTAYEGMLASLLAGKDVGLMSEAGCPGVADPGSAIVQLAHQRGIPVRPLTGPSSILLALMASGLNGQNFCFRGYLPRESAGRKSKLRELEIEAVRKNITQIFIETPYRNAALLEDILNVCGDETMLCLAVDLTSKAEFVKSLDIKSWKSRRFIIEKKPAIFLLGRR